MLMGLPINRIGEEILYLYLFFHPIHPDTVPAVFNFFDWFYSGGKNAPGLCRSVNCSAA